MNILKNIKKNTIFLLIITVVVLYFVLKDNFLGIINVLKTMNIFYIFIALILFFVSIALKGYVNYLIVNDKNKVSIRESIKHNLITQFFNGITPFSSGGQPMEIYMLTEHNISLIKATNYTVQGFIFYQIALVICGILAVLYNFIFHIFPKVKLLQHLVLLGFIINIIVVIVIIATSFSKTITKKMSSFTYKVVRKLKIKTPKEEIDKKFLDYYQGFQVLNKNKRLMFCGIILNIASLLCLYIIPIFIMYSLNDFNSISVMETVTASAYVYLIGAFVPIPGASGGIEFGFTRFFGNFISSKVLSATVLIWRFITYYLGIIVGAIFFNLEKKVK